MKIRDRLTLTLSITSLLAIAALSFSAYVFTSRFHKKEFFKRLEERVQLTEWIYLEKNEVITDAVRGRFLQQLDEELEFTITLEATGVDSLNNLFHQGLATDLLENDFVRFWQGKRQGVAKLYSIESGQYAVVVTALDVFGYSKLDYLKKILIVGGIVCVGLLVAVSWLSITQALMPLIRKIEKAQRISASQLDLRLNVYNPGDELGQLAITFNSMLDRLQAAFESQKQFVSNASHEMRNPLTAIIGEADVLLSKERSNYEYKEAVTTMLEEAKRLNTLTQQLLELAKTESLKKLPDPEKVSLETCLLNTLEKFPIHRLQLNFENNEDDLYISANDFLLHTALTNLIENAMKYSGEAVVTIELKALTNSYEVKISDTGIGIPPADLERILQPLYRARNARSIKGHGIGLTLAKKILELHGGTLHFESQINEGTTATVLLPKF